MSATAEAAPQSGTAAAPGAIDDVIGRLQRPALALARRIVGDDALAEDVVQEVFLACWRRPDAFDPARGTLASWLMAMVHHKAVDAVRREESERRRRLRAAEGGPAGGGDTTDVATLAGERETAARVRAALGRLSSAQREVLVLGYWGGYTQREISRRTGTPLGTVKTRMLSGVRRLSAELRAV